MTNMELATTGPVVVAGEVAPTEARQSRVGRVFEGVGRAAGKVLKVALCPFPERTVNADVATGDWPVHHVQLGDYSTERTQTRRT